MIRGRDNRNLPGRIGGARLSKASVYRGLGEEDGVGDHVISLGFGRSFFRCPVGSWFDFACRNTRKGPMGRLEADYLAVGAWAMGMARLEQLLAEAG